MRSPTHLWGRLARRARDLAAWLRDWWTEPAVEYPWRAGSLSSPPYRPGTEAAALVEERAREVARATLGEAAWDHLVRYGHLDVPSRRYPGVSYRLRVGHRVEVRCAPGARSPWSHRYLCVNPAYPLPRLEFLAQLYLYARDREDELARVAMPTPLDGPPVPTF